MYGHCAPILVFLNFYINVFGCSRAGVHAYKKENIKSDERSGYRTGKRTRVPMQFGCLFLA